MFTLEDGKAAVMLAREAIDSYVRGDHSKDVAITPKVEITPRLLEKGGAFVTINTFPDGSLRGCIGYVDPIYPLNVAIHEVAMSATRDPRFPPLSKDELDRVVVEVSLLSPPEVIHATGEDLLDEVEIGKHGLIAKCGPWHGLLLPQVPVEYGWDVRTYLSYTCMKAGLPPDAWESPSTTIQRFTADVFEEIEPRGEVRRKDLKGCHA